MQKLCTLQELLQHKGVIEARMGCNSFLCSPTNNGILKLDHWLSIIHLHSFFSSNSTLKL